VKLAILGGSFNPLHIGHAMLAESIVKELGYDKVLFIPTCIPPHKEIKGGATTEQRLAMVKAFCESFPEGCFELEPCEVERGGVSYTCDTLKYIQEKYKGKLTGKPAISMGEEIAAEFYHWKNVEQIVEMADIIIVPRYPDFGQTDSENKNTPSGEYKGDFKSTFSKENFAYPYTMLKSPMVPVSSTEIRKRISEGTSYRYLVPPAVFDYIEKEGIYLTK